MKTEIRYGTRVKEERLKRGWTQEHLAEIADVTARTVARIEKGEVQGLESLMAIAAAFEMELGKLGQVFRIAEAKPLRSLTIRRSEDLQVALNRAHHSGLYRPMLLPMRTDLQVRAEELLEIIFSDLQYLSPDEPEVMRSWVQSVKEPVEELHGMGMELSRFRIAARDLSENRATRISWRTGQRAITFWCWSMAASQPRNAFIASMSNAERRLTLYTSGYVKSRMVRRWTCTFFPTNSWFRLLRAWSKATAPCASQMGLPASA